jgi:hypothetical protein
VSPYGYCKGNPLKYIDPTGAFASPIYDREGELLGTDDQGLQGDAIVMNEKDFTQGMSHKEAKKKDLGKDGLKGKDAVDKFEKSVASLPERPDYDGYLTKAEADKWWNEKSGEPLYVDQSKIELHGINTNSFGKSKSIYKNFIWGMTNTGKVYGTLKMTLIDAQTGKVHIGGADYLDKYDFNMDGRLFRDFATWLGRPGGINDGKDFIIRSYGYATVPAVIKR